MHVAGACLFELPDGAGADFLTQLVADMQIDKIPPTFPFNQILHQHLFWQKDEDFRVQHHFRHVALPKPAGITELFNYVSREHARVMDRQKPLWELHLIEGIAPECAGRPMRFAIYLKIHHSVADGVAAMRLFQSMLSKSPDERLSLPIWALTTKERSQINNLLPKNKSAYQIAKEQLGSILPVGRELGARLKDRAKPDFTSSFDAPPSILNQRIQSSRQVMGQAFDKGRFERIAAHFNVTTNDVVLAVCAGALRAYLLTADALPPKPLIALVPVSLRKDGSRVGNQLSFLLANLATHKSDALTRLHTIASSIQDGKTRFGRMTQTQIINYSAAIYGLAGINLATGMLPKKQAFNLIISNVPGIKEPLYLNGARLNAIYPASVLFDGQALNITLANFQDKIDFGITACDIALPHIGKLLGLLADELVKFEQLLD